MNPLSPLGWLYALGTDVRNALYDRGVLNTHSLGARTISVGNLTTGGTGKTPLVALISRLLADKGEKVCILTRGYGRKDSGKRVLVSAGNAILCDAKRGGDEPVELAYKLIGKAAVVADRDRVAAANFALEHLKSTAFVLDDAFQHRRARRDIDIVCIDSTNPFGNGEVLPAGTLRENVKNLSRADVIVITRTDLVKDVYAIEKEVRRANPFARIFRSSNKIVWLVELDRFLARDTRHADETEMPRAFAFCGLGNPSNFFRQLEIEGLNLAGRKTFPDHYFYSADDIADIERKARSVGAECLITTVKDAVRLKNIDIKMDCHVAEIETVMADLEGFRESIFS